ncbi:MAG: hypothetical protein ABIH23_20785 [bacterium]
MKHEYTSSMMQIFTPIPRWLQRSLLLLLATIACAPLSFAAASSEEYQHPAGYISPSSIQEMRDKYRNFDWARKIIDEKRERCDEWLSQGVEKIQSLIPRKRVGVYHLLTCPDTKVRLDYSFFDDTEFTSPKTGKVYPAEERSPVYPDDSPLAGTYYDGWGCLFVQMLSNVCRDCGILYQVLEEPRYAEFVSRVYLYYADNIAAGLEQGDLYGSTCLLTYGREGDSWILFDFVLGYELVRDAGFLTEQEKWRVEEQFLRVVCEKAVKDDEYHVDHNNIPNWLGTVIQTGIAIGDESYLQFGFGYGEYSPEKRPNHRSMAYMAEHHFKEDGAHWELCSGYHLYAARPFARNAIMGHKLAVMKPDKFPPKVFDYLAPEHPYHSLFLGIARWPEVMCTFDGRLPTVGDSMVATGSPMEYDPFGEIVHRYCRYKELGLEEKIRRGERAHEALLLGVPSVKTEGIDTRSGNLASGYAVLKRNTIYAAVNALKPGGGHQHADRLNLVTYSLDRLMGMEKATPYNDLSLRGHATYSWAHNLVIVDKTSQPQGEQLKRDQIPQTTQFLDLPDVGVIRVEGDRLYPNIQAYNRTVFSIENVLVDIFHVEGGELHDFIYHNYGEIFLCDANLKVGSTPFDTPDYILGGTETYECATTDSLLTATWELAGVPDSVYPGRKRAGKLIMTLLPAPNTQVFHLRTHPFQQEQPLTHTILARRKGPVNIFVAVYESTFDQPTFLNAATVGLPNGTVVELSFAGKEIVIFCRRKPGIMKWKDFSTDGVYAVLAYSEESKEPALAVLGSGKHIESRGFKTIAEEEATLALIQDTSGNTCWSRTGPVHYTTYAEGNRYPELKSLAASVRIGNEPERRIVFTATDAEGGAK